jgi:hypothetical protein
LLHNTMREGDMFRDQKIYFRWLGPYRIKEAIALKDIYILEKLNGVELDGTVVGSRLKRFHVRSEVQQEFTEHVSAYGKLPIRTSLEVDLGIPSSETSEDTPEKTSEETSDVEKESFGSEAGAPSPRRDAQRERLARIFVPARI